MLGLSSMVAVKPFMVTGSMRNMRTGLHWYCVCGVCVVCVCVHAHVRSVLSMQQYVPVPAS
jgi:hypothetical protein